MQIAGAARTARRTTRRPTRPGRSGARARHPAARAAWPPSTAAPARRCPALEANAICPRSRSTCALLRARPVAPASAVASSSSSRVERAGLQIRLRGRERPRGPRPGFARQHDRALEERRRRGHAAAGLRPASRPLELRGDLLIGSRRRRGQMPGPPIRVTFPIGRLGQRLVRRPALRHRRRPSTPPSAPADGETAPEHRSRSNPADSAGATPPGRDPEPLAPPATAAPGSPTGSAAATSNSRRVSSGSAPSRRWKLSSIRPGQRLSVRQPEPARQLS